MPNQRNRYPARRRFLKQSAALTASASLAAPAAVLGAAPGAVDLHFDGADAAARALAFRLGAELARVLQQPVRVLDEVRAERDAGSIVLWLQPAPAGGVAIPARVAAAGAPTLAAIEADGRRFELRAAPAVPAALAAAARAAARALHA